MEQNKGFWYADWSFPIFVGLLSSGVFAGTHMYYLYGIGAFNEVAFVAMLKSGIDTGVYGAVAAFGASFLFARIIEGSLVGILDIGGAIQTGIGLGVPALLLGAGFVFPVANFAASLVTGLVLGLAVGYVRAGILRQRCKLAVGGIRNKTTFSIVSGLIDIRRIVTVISVRLPERTGGQKRIVAVFQTL